MRYRVAKAIPYRPIRSGAEAGPAYLFITMGLLIILAAVSMVAVQSGAIEALNASGFLHR